MSILFKVIVTFILIAGVFGKYKWFVYLVFGVIALFVLRFLVRFIADIYWWFVDRK